MQQPDAAFLGSLTDRERDVLPLLANGLRNKEIAVQLSMAEGTVRVHVNNILKKAGVNTRAAVNARVLGRSVDVPSMERARISRAKHLGLIDEEQERLLIGALPPVAA